MDIPVKLLSDEKGYLDRECPNENCLFNFKINMQDWSDNISGKETHCPMCGYVDSSDKWWTPAQLEAMREIAINYTMNMVFEKLDDAFNSLAKSTRRSKYLKITYKPGKRISFKNNPIGQSEEWITDITCDNCGTRYSVIGSAYFCPCCGYNSAVSVFDESLDNIEKMLESLSEMKELLTKSYGIDKAEMMCRGLLESSLGDIVSAFQKFAECIFKTKSSSSVRVNDFQIVEKGSKLFFEAVGKGYNEWLSDNELKQMNLLFQRRHILEHNGGIVDERYINQSGDSSYTLGQHLVIHKQDTLDLLGIIKKLSTGLKTI